MAPLPAPFLEACLRRPTPFTPVWLMRQAGRYLPEYRALRARYGFLELCKTPAAAAEVTLQPVERLGVDAAILFADILLVLEPLGVGLEFTKGDGPRIQRPVRSAEDVRRMPSVDIAEAVGYVFETVRLVRKALGERVPLIGFAGAPFTLASYLIEGGPSREFLATKRFMRDERTAWDALLTRLADVTAEYLNGQIAAGRPGRAALRLVGGRAVTVRLPRARAAIFAARDSSARARRAGHPLRHRHRDALAADEGGRGRCDRPRLARGDRAHVGAARATTWRCRATSTPPFFCSSTGEIRRAASLILDAVAGRPGHVFNLGHGVHKETPVDHVIALVDIVHELSSR